jgi:hypothetical protein
LPEGNTSCPECFLFILSILEANRGIFNMLVDGDAGIMFNFLLGIEEHSWRDGEEKRAEADGSRQVDYSQVSKVSFVVVEDIGIWFKYRYDGEYWYREWEIGGIGFTYEPVVEWVVSFGDRYIKEAYRLCSMYFCILYLYKESPMYRWFLLKLEELDKKYSEKKGEVSIDFDEPLKNGSRWKGQLVKKSESILLLEADGGDVYGRKIFEVVMLEKRENREIATEIQGRVIDGVIKKEIEKLKRS